MDSRYTFIRVWTQTAYQLKIVAATRRKTMIEVIAMLVAEEWKRLRIPLEAGMADEHDEEAASEI